MRILSKNIIISKYTGILICFIVIFTIGCNTIEPVLNDYKNINNFSSDTFLIIVPHPDDEILGYGGLIYDALKAHKTVKVVIITNGDFYDEANFLWKNGCPYALPACKGVNLTKDEKELFGLTRIEESKKALKLLGFNLGDLIILGYPDGAIEQMFLDSNRIYNGNTSRTLSLNNRSFSGKSLKYDLREIMHKFPKANVFTTHIMDSHKDHSYLSKFVKLLSNEIGINHSQYQIYNSIIHEPFVTYNGFWPEPALPLNNDGDYSLLREQRYKPNWELNAPKSINEEPIKYFFDNILWNNETGKPLLRQAIECFKTQEGSININGQPIEKKYIYWIDRNGYLLSFVKKNHLFWRIN